MARAKKTGKRKASAAQLAGLKKARAALKVKYGTTNIAEIRKLRGRRGTAKSRRPKKTAAPRAAARPVKAAQEQENEEMALEENPRKRRRRKGGKKRRRARAENPRPKRRRARKKATHRKRRSASTHRRRKSAHRRPAHRRKSSHRRRRSNPHVKAYRRKKTVKRYTRKATVRAHNRRKARKRTHVRARRDNPGMSTGLVPAGMSGSAYGGLLSNPMGPYSARSLTAYGWAVGGIGIGLVFADVVDRYVATRKPADTKGGGKGMSPWYGRDAAAAMARRPDGWRLGAQALGGVASLGLAYVTRRNRVLPWLLGGAALGFGGNLFMKLINWWVMPSILKVDDFSKPSAGNRLYPLEQKSVQDAVNQMFDNWEGVASLAAGQQQQPVIASPLSDTPSSDVYTLGEPGQAGAPPLSGAAGQQALNGQSGRVGACHSCGGMPGHYANCPELCPDCPGGSGVPGTDDHGGGGDGGGGGRLCTWVVREGDDLRAIVNEAGVNINDVSALNGGGEPSTYWYAGNTVRLPYAACVVVLRQSRPRTPPPPPARVPVPAQPQTPPVTTTSLPQSPPPAVATIAPSLRTPGPAPAMMAIAGAENERRSMSFGADETEDE